MKSKWYELKEKAIVLRQNGSSIRSVELALNIPRSTLSGWFKNIKLNRKQQAVLLKNWSNALAKARQKAVLWHNSQKAERIAQAEEEARSTLKNINLKDKNILDLALAMLYLGEGSKGSSGTGMGNTNPGILRFFIKVLRRNYGLKISDIKADLHIRADQNPEEVKNFWIKELGLPKENFMSVSVDYRTKGSKTYPSYHGVCVIRCQRYAIQRKLMFLSKLVCEQVSKI